MRCLFGSTHTVRARCVSFAVRQFARAWGSPEIHANHLVLGLIAEDQEQLPQLPGLPDEVRRRMAVRPLRTCWPLPLVAAVVLRWPARGARSAQRVSESPPVAKPHPRFLSAKTAAALRAQIEAGRGQAPELPFEAPVSVDAAVKRIHGEAARLARGQRGWALRTKVDTQHYWRALLESSLPEGAAMLSRFPEFEE